MKNNPLFKSLIFTALIFLLPAKNKAQSELSTVYTSEKNKSDKAILKLYNDKTYERYHLHLVRNKPVSNREKGEYKIRRGKLVLHPNHKKSIDFPCKYYLKDGIGLFTRKPSSCNECEADLKLSHDEKFQQSSFYYDEFFGNISNEKKKSGKILNKELIALPKQPDPIDPLKDSLILAKKSRVLNSIKKAEAKKEQIKLSSQLLHQIKVVIVVGSDEIDNNRDFIEEQTNLAYFLKEMGLHVVELYYPNAKWETVKEASKDAHIFIYSGHGNTLGEDKMGTLCLNEGIIDGSELITGLKLRPNALVMLNHACFSAGSSASDNADIGLVEAVTRVENYAKPFMKLYSGCYYANNFSGSMKPFLIDFFNGASIDSIYTKNASKYSKIIYRKSHRCDERYQVGVSSNEARPNTYGTKISMDHTGKINVRKYKTYKNYHVAFVGKPKYSINDLLMNTPNN